jgi:hypothetical protein
MTERSGHMPASAAHYQFGQDILNRLDPDLKSVVLAYKQEFDIGLQGPDIFFFYKPYRKTEIAEYGHKRHDQAAIRMFITILEKVRDKAALSYMIGLICHYTLDACCHPYVYKHSPDMIDHQLMEAAYDRHIISRSGLARARHLMIPASGLDFRAMAELWPGMSARIIRKCVKSQRNYTWLLDHKGILSACEAIAGKQGAFLTMSLPDALSRIQQKHAWNLDTLYSKALEECPKRIGQSFEAMGTKLTNQLGFDMNYMGEAVHEQDGEKLDTL